jgi:hypothetical protein
MRRLNELESRHQPNQSSIFVPAILSNSFWLCATRVMLLAMAEAAIRISSDPIGFPCFSSLIRRKEGFGFQRRGHRRAAFGCRCTPQKQRRGLSPPDKGFICCASDAIINSAVIATSNPAFNLVPR